MRAWKQKNKIGIQHKGGYTEGGLAITKENQRKNNEKTRTTKENQRKPLAPLGTNPPYVGCRSYSGWFMNDSRPLVATQRRPPGPGGQ